jgi:hypothetical protein
MSAWWLFAFVGFWNLAEGNFLMAILMGLLCWFFGDFE